ADRGDDAGDEDAGPACVPLRPALCGLARANSKRPFHRGQDQARQDHPRRRRGPAQPAGGGGGRGDPAGPARPWPPVTLAGRPAEAQAAKTRGGGARQQDCPHRLEADGDGRELRRRADAWRIGIRRLGDRLVGRFAAPAEPELQEETDGRIDRSEVRDSPWDPLACKGRWRVWSSRRGNHLGQRSKAAASTGRTYGCKRSDQTRKNSCGTGAVHIWVPAFAGTTMDFAGTTLDIDEPSQSVSTASV